MIKIKVHGLKRVKRNLQSLPIAVKAKGKVYFKANEKRFSTKAKEIVKQVVYDTYKPHIYNRTYRLLNSARAVAVHVGNTNMIIYCDPSMTPGQQGAGSGWGWHDTFNTYSKDVLAGTGSVGRIAGARNWLPLWKIYFGRVIPAEYNNTVKSAIRQTFSRGRGSA